MKITISRATDYPGRNIPSMETYDLEVESNGMEDSGIVVATYLEIREKLDKAIKEEK